jgi:hypothetical protein
MKVPVSTPEGNRVRYSTRVVLVMMAAAVPLSLSLMAQAPQQAGSTYWADEVIKAEGYQMPASSAGRTTNWAGSFSTTRPTGYGP